MPYAKFRSHITMLCHMLDSGVISPSCSIYKIQGSYNQAMTYSRFRGHIIQDSGCTICKIHGSYHQALPYARFRVCTYARFTGNITKLCRMHDSEGHITKLCHMQEWRYHDRNRLLTLHATLFLHIEGSTA